MAPKLRSRYGSAPLSPDNERAVLITTLRRLVDFHQVVSFKSPADTPAMPGMLRKSAAFVPRYQKFESISLQQTVRLSPDFTRVSGKVPVFRQFGGDAVPQGRERHRGARQPAKRSASVSVGQYSSTAMLPDAARDIGSAGRERGQVSASVEL
jgi:hypothetical protein